MAADTRPPVPLTALWAGVVLSQCGYFMYIAYASLKHELKDMFSSRAGLSQPEFEYFYGLLWSVYALPNFVSPLALGMITDRFGAATVLLLLALTVGAGTFLQCAGVASACASLVLAGRFFLGVGVENLYLVTNIFCGEFLPVNLVAVAGGFLGLSYNLALAFGTLVAVQLLGHGGLLGLHGTMATAAALVLLGVLLMMRQRRAYEAAAKAERDDTELECLLGTQADAHSKLEPERKSELKSERGKVELEPERLTWQAVAVFLCIVAGSMSNTICVFVFFSCFQDVLREIWPLPGGASEAIREQRASDWMSFLQLLNACISPLTGAVASRFGRSGVLVYTGLLSQTAAHFVYWRASAIPGDTRGYGPLLPVLLLAISNASVAPLLFQLGMLVVPAQHLGTAIGGLVVMYNLGMSLWPLLVAYLRNLSGDYRSSIVAFLICGCSGQLILLLGLLIDRTCGKGRLSKQSDAGSEACHSHFD